MPETPGRWPGSLKTLLPFAGGIGTAGALASKLSVTSSPALTLLVFAVSILALLVAAGIPAVRRTAGSFAVVLFLAGFLRAAIPAALPASAPVAAAAARRDTVVVSGIADRVERRASGVYRIVLRLRGLEDGAGRHRASGDVSLTWPDSIPPPLEGARLACRTTLQPLKGPTNPGEWNGPEHFRRRGIFWRAHLRRPGDLVEHHPPATLSMGRGLHAARKSMGSAIDRRLDGFPRRFARVLLIGDRVAFQPSEEADFRLAGVTHVLSVSGLHVGLVAATVQLLLGKRRRLPALLVALGATWGYTLLVAAPSAAVRSAAMLTMVMVARHTRRPLAGPPLLAGASFLLLALAPMLLFDLGFLLSVLSIAGLLVSHGLLASWTWLAGAPRPARVALETLGLTFGAQAATAPLTIALWGDWPLVAPLANLLVVGISDLVLTAGLVALALDLFQPAAAEGVFAVVWAFSKIIGFCVHQLAVHSPGITGLTAPPAGVPAAYVLAIAGAVTALHAGCRRMALGLFAAWGITFVLLVAAPRFPPAGLRLTVLDIGQGDATLLEFPDGRTMLIDAGEGGARDTGGRVVLPALRSARLRNIDAVVVSHAHHDHQGGLLKVMEGARVRKVFESGYGPGDGEPARFRDLCWSRRAPICLVAAGDTLLAGPGYAVTALWPERPADIDDYERPGNVLNDLSLVLLVEWKGRRLVLPGDLEEGSEHLVIGRLPRGPVDYLKAGHHGSRTSSSVAWLEVLKPRVASVSCGTGNKFRHPSKEVMARYLDLGTAVHRTDRGGALRLTWSEAGVTWERWGDGLGRGYRRGSVPDGSAWPAAFLDRSGTIW